jgi:tetratricopeptide (TPR) repeat protein
MVALYRSGRQADALTQFERTRRLLADELGVDPGTGLQQLYQRILTSDLEGPPAPMDPVTLTPRQLPSDIRGFVGRHGDIAGLDKIMGDVGGAPNGSVPIVISAIDGSAGIGKTALAVHWAHHVKHHFPDGQLYLNLRGYGPGEPVTSGAALAAMLRSLDVAGDRIPAGVDERSALLRSTLAARRMLILLDNAQDSDQVRPLLPGSDALVIVTSRRKLHSLSVRDGARHLTLNLLSHPEALELFAEAIGTDRIGREPAEAVAIIELCARLPLALRLAAERANRQPTTPLRELVAELTDQRGRLATLSIEGSPDTDLRSVFAWSYAALEPEAARMFDFLGLHPGNGISVSAAAALAGVPPEQAAATLEQLTNASMLEQRFRGRFEMHDLLREYASDHAERHAGEHSAARGRLLQWYVHTAANARAQLTEAPHRLPIAPNPPEGITPEQFAGYQAGLEWFDAEQDAIVEIALSAGDHGHGEGAAVLGQLSWHYLYLRGLWQQLLVVGESTAEYASAIGNLLLEAKIRNGLSVPYGKLPGFAHEEIETSRQALSIFERLDDLRGQAGCLLNLGVTTSAVERFAEAREHLERARDLYEKDGDRLYSAFALNNLAIVYRSLDRLDDALHCARQAVDYLQGCAEPFRLVQALVTIADVYAAGADHHAAAQSYRDALAVADRIGNTYQLIPLRIDLGKQLSAAGSQNEAIGVWQEAYQICLERDDPAAEEIQRLLALPA